MQTNVAVKIEAKNLSAMTKSRRLWCLGVLATLFGCASHPGIMFRKNLNAGVYKSLDQCMSAALEVMSQRLSKYDAVSNHHSNRRDCYYRFGMYAEGQEELRLSLEMGRIESAQQARDQARGARMAAVLSGMVAGATGHAALSKGSRVTSQQVESSQKLAQQAAQDARNAEGRAFSLDQNAKLSGSVAKRGPAGSDAPDVSGCFSGTGNDQGTLRQTRRFRQGVQVNNCDFKTRVYFCETEACSEGNPKFLDVASYGVFDFGQKNDAVRYFFVCPVDARLNEYQQCVWL